jgi:hypothetical protein
VATSFRPTGLLRWAPLGGIVYVALFVVGLILLNNGRPNEDAPPTKVIPYYQDSGHRDKIHLGMLLVLVGVFFLIWFVAALRELVVGYAGPGMLAAVTAIGGAAYAALTLASVALQDAVYTMSDDTFGHTVYPGLIHAANDAGYVLHSAGGVGVGAMMVAVSAAALGARAVPAWLGWLGVAAGIVAIFAVFFFPWIVIAVWLIVASALTTRAFGRLSAAAAPARSG